MTDRARAAPPAAPPPVRRQIDRLLPFGFAGSLGLTLVLMAGSVAAFGSGLTYWRMADQDLVIAYQGLLFADGLPQEYFDHTGYLSYLLTGAWYDLLNAVSLLPVHAVSEVPPVADAASHEAAWSALIDWGRALSLLLAAILVTGFGLLVRRLAGDWRVAAIAAFVLAFSGGLAFHMRIMRTELVSGGLIALAAAVLLIAAREPKLRGGPLAVGVAAFLAGLAVVAKVQAIVPVMGLPLLAFAWGRADTGPARSDWRLAMALALPALIAAGLASWLLVSAAGSEAAVFSYLPFIPGLPGLYQAVLAAWIIGSIVLFARLYRLPSATIVATLLAILLGVALAVLTLAIRFHPQNALALLQPVEHMFQFATFSNPDLAGSAAVVSEGLFGKLIGGVGEVLAVRSFILQPSFRPTILVEWFLIAAAVHLWLRGDRRTAIAIGISLITVWGIDVAFTLRSLNINYLIYTEPLVIIVAALAMVRLPEPGRPAVRALAAALVAMAAVSQIEPLKLRFGAANPDLTCPFNRHYMPRLETFPYCTAAGYD